MTQTALLFVYGTLMRRAQNAPLGGPERQRLWAESSPVSDATIRGWLYDFGAYPGLVLDEAQGRIVTGEVLALSKPDATFAWLDAYEMIVPGKEDESEYQRTTAAVQLTGAAGHSETTAWVYVTRRNVSTVVPIAGGRWV